MLRVTTLFYAKFGKKAIHVVLTFELFYYIFRDSLLFMSRIIKLTPKYTFQVSFVYNFTFELQKIPKNRILSQKKKKRYSAQYTRTTSDKFSLG